jgi:hypothetical protein
MADTSLGLSVARLAGSSVQGGQTDPRPAPNAIELAHTALDEASDLASRVESMVDRLCGAGPAQQPASGGVSPTGSVLPGLRDSASRTRDRLSSANARLNQLERETA